MGWFHASPHDLPVGMMLQPGAGLSPWRATLYATDPVDAAARSKWVWVDTDPLIWAGSEMPFVYEVRPLEEPRLWYDDDPDEGWVTSAAVITAVLSRDGGVTWLDEPQ